MTPGCKVKLKKIFKREAYTYDTLDTCDTSKLFISLDLVLSDKTFMEFFSFQHNILKKL